LRRAAGVLAALVLGCGAAPESGEPLDPSALWGSLAPPEQALTFARRMGPGGRELLLVTGIERERVAAWVVPGAVDPITALEREDAAAVLARAQHGVRVSVPVAELGLPADLGERHVAAGTNFRAHGEEVGVETPFLFPKLVAPTPWASEVPAAARLDYEVELCFVALRPLASGSDVPGAFGVLLCNDFTDRWTLAKGMLGRGEMGTRGFADAKGRPGFLPVGPFLVVPRDLDAWLAGVTLELWVNGLLRQRAPATDMVWPLPELAERAFAWRERPYRHAGGSVSLLPDGRTLAARTLVLSGTPGGVIFRLANLWRGSLYLQPGDEVVARATGLGALRNRVAPD
jgi:2-keto-4-pentenoate hydratase/2-oxohepta-3-ene-1,7-dioic acid hydratase in catechol pathway